MLDLPRLQIRNIKVSVLLEQDLNPSLITSTVSHHENFVLTIYPNKRDLVNVTKLGNIDQLFKIQDIITSKFGIKCRNVKIDAMMLTRKVRNRQFSMNKILDFLKHQNDFELSFNSELFHAPSVKSKFGTFNLFASGSCTVMGAKTLEDIDSIEVFLNQIYCKENEIKE